MTQAEFAQRVGVSQGFLSYAERGEKEIGAATLFRRSVREFGKTIEWLLTGKGFRGTQVSGGLKSERQNSGPQ